MARQFRIEHLALKPKGYKVRTVTRDGHRVRIAFPPGRRVKGSGIPLEVLHPMNENPGCRYSNPAELVVMMNPSGAELVVMGANPAEAETATRKYEEFHGLPSEYIDEHDEPTPRSRSLAELGDLLEIRVKSNAGWKWRSIDLSKCGVKLASNAKGTQLYAIGGDQRLRSFAPFDADRSKEVIDLGEARYIAYRTRKAMAGGNLASYEHALGEETGKYPRLLYDRRGSQPRLIFAGGEYRVEAPGIIN